MNNITITDIFGNKISNDKDNNNTLPFILLHISQPHLVLEKIIGTAMDTICKLKLPIIFRILYKYNINPTQFAPLGDIWISTTTLPKEVTILLINNNNKISTFPIDFVKIDSYRNINIWKPVCQIGYKELGLITGETKPSLKSMKCVNEKYLIKYQSPATVIGRNTNMNEYSLLSNIDLQRYTINKNKILNKNQKISYTVQGELKVDGKCISVGNNTLNSQTCEDSNMEKWYPYDSESERSPIWTQPANTEELDNSWECQPGKKVILVEAEIPWYVYKNKDISEIMLNKTKDKDTVSNLSSPNDQNPPDSTNKNKPFIIKKQKTLDFNAIACFLLLLIFLLVIVRYCMKEPEKT